MNLLAHQGGWDEIVIPVVVVGAFVLASRRKRARQRLGRDPATHKPWQPDETGSCAYCGQSMSPTDIRCAGCGFRGP